MDKWRTKLLWRSVGFADSRVRDAGARTATFPQSSASWGLPLFVKPACEGSSIGVSKVRQAGRTARRLRRGGKARPLVIAEKGVLGGEYTCAIVGDTALPIIKIEPATDFYDYEAKYLRDDTQYRCPCDFCRSAKRSCARRRLRGSASSAAAAGRGSIF
jgi:D-alanine-D-alanine ligase